MANAVFGEIFLDLRARDLQQRADDIAAPVRYALQARAAAAPGKVEKHRLRVVVGIVRRGYAAAAESAGRLVQECISQLPRGFFRSKPVLARITRHIPVLHCELYAEPSAQLFDKARVAQGFVPAYAVLIVRGVHLKALPERKRVHRMQQTHGIRPAGHGAKHFFHIRRQDEPFQHRVTHRAC